MTAPRPKLPKLTITITQKELDEYAKLKREVRKLRRVYRAALAANLDRWKRPDQPWTDADEKLAVALDALEGKR